MAYEEEKKEYSVVGRVEIGTDEYRDLIETVEKGKRDYDRRNTEWYEQYKKANLLEEQVKKMTEKELLFDEFLKSIERTEAFKAFVIQKRFNDMEEN